MFYFIQLKYMLLKEPIVETLTAFINYHFFSILQLPKTSSAFNNLNRKFKFIIPQEIDPTQKCPIQII